MALLSNVFQQLFGIVILAFQIAHSLDSDSVQRSSGKKTLVICENRRNHIECRHGLITVKNAYYGRKDEHTCPSDKIFETNCMAEDSLDLILKKCDNESKCQLEASNDWFGDPCPGTHKYIRVDYTCSEGNHIHKEIICESHSKKISCPEGRILKFKYANYGRTERAECPDKNIETTNCIAPDSLQIVQDKCENKKQCVLEANNDWFEDPCEGTHKYLQVEYQCVQDHEHRQHQVTICENKTQKIKCPRGTKLIIEGAFYGRTEKSICPHKDIKDTDCDSGNGFSVVDKRCKHKKECELHSSNSWFGDPCEGTHKYLQVEYKCVQD